MSQHTIHVAKFGAQVAAVIKALDLPVLLGKIEAAERTGGASPEFLDTAGMRCAAAAEGLKILSDRLGEAAQTMLDQMPDR